jgi:hypothetical protein
VQGGHKPPAPLDDLVSIAVHDLTDVAALDRVATRVLILMAMRVSGENQQLFIAYRQKDGLMVARAIEAGLEKRGFRIWRDDKPDRDGLPLISPGDPAQLTIHQALARQSGVLVIDTPEAPNSPWVLEEVNTSLALMLPVLPVVVEGPAGTRNPVPPVGGRFPSLGLLGNEVRVSAGSSVTDQTLDGIEHEITRLLLQQLSSRHRLIGEAAQQFQAMGFTWREFERRHLLFTAEAPRDSSETPELRLRLLVQCAPYRRLLYDTLETLCTQLRASSAPFQYGIIVHDAIAYQPELRRLLVGRGGHVMALNADKLDTLKRAIRVD